MTCTVCEKPVKYRGLCYSHYMRQWRYGTTDKPRMATVGYRAAHERMGKAAQHPCVDCGKQASDWSYKEASGYSNDPTDYAPRCRPCHKRKDA